MACGGQPLKLVFNGAVSEGDSAPAVARGHDWKQSSRSELIGQELHLLAGPSPAVWHGAIQERVN
jgi:hypothetical protein